MKHSINSINIIPNVQYREKKNSNKSLELRETIIPASYIIALAKEKQCLKNIKSQNYPSLKDLLKSRSKDHLDPLTLRQSLDLFLKGKLYCIEDLKGNLRFLKFVGRDTSSKNFNYDIIKQKNYLNLDKIPVYIISTGKNDFLTFKVFKNQEYILGFLNFEDAFTYLNEFQRNKIWKEKTARPFKKFPNLKNEQSIKIVPSNMETFYKIWANTKFKASLVPGNPNFGKKVYVTKNPFYQTEGKNIFLTGFSKDSINKILQEVKGNKKELLCVEANDFFDLSNQKFQNKDNFYYFVPHKDFLLKNDFLGKELQEATRDNLPEVSIFEEDTFEILTSNSTIIPSTFLKFLPNSLRTYLYTTLQDWSEKTALNVEKRQKRRNKRKRRRKSIRNRFLVRRRTRRYFRKANIYKMIQDRDKHFLSSHKVKRIDSYRNSILNNQKKWLRGLSEKNPSGSYSGPYQRKPEVFNPDTWRLLKYLKREKALTCKQQIFRIPKKRKLTSKKIWRLRQLFFKKMIVQKHSNHIDTLQNTKYLIEKSNKYPLKSDLSIGEFLEKFKVLELQQKKKASESNSALADSFVLKK